MDLPAALALALAGAGATLIETVLFNSLTVWRTRVQAGRAGLLKPSLLHAVPLQLFCLLARRPMTLVVQAALAAKGLSAFASGCAAGAIEGVLFTPTRRLTTMQLADPAPPRAWALARDVVRREGVRGLWLGWPVNLVRTTLGAGAYFAAVAGARAVLPGGGHLVHGAIGSATATLVLNPFEVALALLYTGSEVPRDIPTMARGLALSLARNVPGGSLRWWLTQVGAAWLAGH